MHFVFVKPMGRWSCTLGHGSVFV